MTHILLILCLHTRTDNVTFNSILKEQNQNKIACTDFYFVLQNT